MLNDIEFLYDHSGVMGVKFDGKTYLYRKDVQGNIIAILDSNGKVMVKYEYDAWGNHEVKIYASQQSTHIGNLNPFRYRGYYYDVETGLYFLKTRYYDPVVGRFITIDGITQISGAINGVNLYAYCGDNPVMRVDATGTSWSDFWNGVKNFFIGAFKFAGGLFLSTAGAVVTVATLPFAIFVPGGGFLTQTGASMVGYGGFMMASVFDSAINADMNAIGWNPFNTDENLVVGSTKVSFYKGVPVIRKSGSGRSGTFLWMFLDNGNATTVRHEWGHTIQQGIVGPVRFLATYAIASIFNPSDNRYYRRPCEVTADIFGGVMRNQTKGEIIKGFGYLAMVVAQWMWSYFFLIGEY